MKGKAIKRITAGIMALSMAGIYTQGDDTSRLITTGNNHPETDRLNQCAGIGGSREDDAGTINIYGGTINVTGGKPLGDSGNGCAGIGGAYGADAGTVRIYGGNITAQGARDSAGIGGGGRTNVTSHVEIYGGTVTAIGGDKGSAGIGAGAFVYIHGGDLEADSTIKICGGDIHVNSSSGGAGIGAGYFGDMKQAHYHKIRR